MRQVELTDFKKTSFTNVRKITLHFSWEIPDVNARIASNRSIEIY